MMIKIETHSYPDVTLGRLWCGNFQCFTLELPWLSNAKNRSCIPADRYLCEANDSTAHGPTLKIQNVLDRTNILIHAGNYIRNTEGCILVGDSIKFLDSDSVPDVTNSRATLNKLLSKIRILPCPVTIQRFGCRY